MNSAPAESVRGASVADRQATAHSPQRTALALGLVGRLGEELLAALMAAPEYRAVFVGVTQMLGSAAPKFRPWLIGRGVVVAQDAFVGITGGETFVPQASPVRRYGEDEVLDAARTARDAGATTLVLVAPLPALLQMGEATRTLASVDEVALVAMGFERLLLVRPTAAEDSRRLPVPLALVRAAGRALADLMLPSYTRALSARTAAAAIIEAVRAAGPGVTVLGAKELAAIVQARMPQQAPRQPRLR
ncbi:MAG: hypothetical protein JSW31_14845 [Burkholderiales bacterium]|nr:MAG: hypothetical protein JSW31_14845 [Burkholderiales bacterium]